jgi:phosphoesterase RecJ-like protein
VGAVLALGLGLDALEKPYTLALPDRAPDFLDFLPGQEKILIEPPVLPPVDLVIVPDCSDLERLGPLYERHEALFTSAPLINIDHHVSNKRFGEVNVVDPQAAAVCEQLFYLFPALGIPIDVAIATCLLTGVVTDTQAFRTPSTTARTMRTATALMEIGAPLTEIANQVYNSKPLARLRLWGRALSALEEADGVVWTYLNEDMLNRADTSWEESEALVNLLASVRTAEVAILFKEMPDGVIRVSLRSAGKVNVADVAAQFGGGGHFGAAGCSLSVPLPTAMEMVVARAREGLAVSVGGGERR